MSEYLASALLDAHVKAGDVDGAFARMAELRAGGLVPSVVTFGVLLDGCARSADVARALAVARELAAAGLALSDACCNMLIVACSRAGLLDEMLAELRAILRRGGDVQRDTLCAMLVALCRYQYAERALRLRALMAARGMEPSGEALCCLVEAAAREGRPADAFAAARDALCAGATLPQPARSAAVVALCRAGELGQALWLAGSGEEAPGAASCDLASVASAPLLAAERREGAAKPAPPPGSLQGLSSSALAVLCASCARVRRTATALLLYELLLARGAGAERGGAGHALAHAGLRAPERLALYAALVQACLLAGSLDEALATFEAAKEDPEAPPVGLLALPAVSLAALAAACRQSERHAHRVYDVCASMRTAREAKLQRQLARPSKPCHHARRLGG